MKNMTKKELIAEYYEIKRLFHNITKKDIWDIQKVMSETEHPKRYEYTRKINNLEIMWDNKTEAGLKAMNKNQLREYLKKLTEDLKTANKLMKEGLEML